MPPKSVYQPQMTFQCVPVEDISETFNTYHNHIKLNTEKNFLILIYQMKMALILHKYTRRTLKYQYNGLHKYPNNTKEIVF